MVPPAEQIAPEVGVFFDLRNPGARHEWAEHVARSLEQVAWAEELGAGSVWFSEHHLFDDGYLSQPLTFAAAAAARTSRVRIGTAIVVAPFRHPRHLAEEAAIVDLVSGGRLELGLGAGYAVEEFAAFGVDPATRYRATDAAAAEVLRLFADGAVQPPPVQRPVPLWLGYQGPKGARRAGRLGVGLLGLRREAVAAYQEGLAEGGHPVGAARVAGVVDLVVSEDPEAAFDRVVPGAAHQQATYRVAHGHRTTPDELAAELRRAGRRPGQGLQVLAPDEAVDHLAARLAGLPVHHVYCWASVGGMPDDLVEEHLRLLLGVVRPRLRARLDAPQEA